MVQELSRRRSRVIWLRARVPVFTRYIALAILILGVLYAAISYYRLRNYSPFRMMHGSPELSKQIEGITHGYERRIMKGERVWIILKAARDIVYSDKHHELEEVYLEVHPDGSDKPDKITASRAITNSITDDTSVKISFTGNVNIETHDSLVVKTETAVYDRATEIAETSSYISFVHGNVSGSSTGAKVDSKNKRLELLSNIEIKIEPEQKAVESKSDSRSHPTIIHSAQAAYDQSAKRIELSGNVTVEQDRDLMSGKVINALLNEAKRLNRIEVRGNSYLRTLSEGHAAEINSADMNILFDNDQKLQYAEAMRDIKGRTLEADSDVEVTTGGNLRIQFQRQKDQSLLKEMHLDGRPVVVMSAPKSRANDPQSANKRLTADDVKLFWHISGRDLDNTKATGKAELIVEPVQADETKDRKTIVAERLECTFLDKDNKAKLCQAIDNAKATFEPSKPTQMRGVRTLTSDKMVSHFFNDTQEVEKLEAFGNVKFNERDRNGQSSNAVYTSSDEVLKLRGGDPVVWDSRARIKAVEIDTDNRLGISYARNKVATTYYSQEQTNGAAPFSKVKNPVYVTSDRAEFHYESGVATYTGDARAWQDDNYVKADKIILRRETKVMEGHGHVQSALYHVKRKDSGGTRRTVPVFATSDRMTYSDINRLVHYEGNVDVKQETDRTTSEVADVYLLKDSYELEKTISERNVIITQPGRRGTGDWSQYTAADETVVLKGDPARVEDAKDGTSEGRRITVLMRENKVVADDEGGSQSTGRVRSVHKVKKP
jgi:LPS export ABC transporter protein LptC/lipopolysaccharide transport protein LptA